MLRIRYSKDDLMVIYKNVIQTGYNDEKDAYEMGEIFHAQDDTAYAFINFNALSSNAREDILDQHKIHEHLPKDFDPDKIKIKFKWNVEWGNWSDLIYDGEKVWDFIGWLPWSLSEKNLAETDIAKIAQVIRSETVAVDAFNLFDWINGTNTGSVEAPRIFKGVESEEKDGKLIVCMIYSYPETHGLSDCRYHDPRAGKIYHDFYEFSDNKIFLNGDEDIFGIKDFSLDLYMDKVRSFYKENSLECPEFIPDVA